MGQVILAAHQPDLLPWSGFFFKMAEADVFDLAIHDQFQTRGYQRRVRMRGSWASVQLSGKPSLCPIHEVRLTQDAPDRLIELVRGRYQGAPFWPRHGRWLIGKIDEARTERLWMFNLALLLAVRERLAIATPIAIATPPADAGTAGLVSLCREYGADEYLSGQGGREYIADWPLDGPRLAWSRHQPSTGESIVTVLMDHPDPREVVLCASSTSR